MFKTLLARNNFYAIKIFRACLESETAPDIKRQSVQIAFLLRDFWSVFDGLDFKYQLHVITYVRQSIFDAEI